MSLFRHLWRASIQARASDREKNTMRTFVPWVDVITITLLLNWCVEIMTQQMIKGHGHAAIGTFKINFSNHILAILGSEDWEMKYCCPIENYLITLRYL
jgi:uncharacterized membrane protein